MLPNPVKSIPNALAWLILATSLSSCSWNGLRRIECDTKPVERVPLNLADPAPLQLTPAKWRIVTPENVDQIWREIETSGNDVVLFAITADGYEQLSLDFAAIRNHINQQRTIIMKYREYYESPQVTK